MPWEESWHLESPLRSKPHGGFGGGRRETDLSRHRARRLSYFRFYKRAILTLLDAASEPAGMDVPGLHLHPMKGEFEGFWSVRVTGNWRIIYEQARRTRAAIRGFINYLVRYKESKPAGRVREACAEYDAVKETPDPTNREP